MLFDQQIMLVKRVNINDEYEVPTQKLEQLIAARQAVRIRNKRRRIMDSNGATKQQ